MATKHQLAFLLKSYSQDAELAARMVTSFHEFNLDNIPLYIVVPDPDLNLFAEFETDNVTLIPESKFDRHLVNEPVHDLRPGYIN